MSFIVLQKHASGKIWSQQSATCKLRGGLKCPHFDPQSEGEDSPSFTGRSNECYQCFQDVVVADSLEDGRRFARGPNDGGNKWTDRCLGLGNEMILGDCCPGNAGPHLLVFLAWRRDPTEDSCQSCNQSYRKSWAHRSLNTLRMPASSAGAICDGWAYPLLEGGFPFWAWAKTYATFFWRNLLLLV